mgnify:CR=1 FL=1
MDVKPDLVQLQQAQHEMMNAAMQAQQQQQGPPAFNPYGFGMSPLHAMQSPHSSMGSPPSLGSPGWSFKLFHWLSFFLLSLMVYIYVG